MKDFLNRLFARIPGKLGRILHYEGPFDGDPSHLKTQKFINNAVQFKEPSMRKFLIIANSLSVGLFFVFWLIYKLVSSADISLIGILIGLLLLVPHEILHASAYNEDVYMYSFLKNGALFVVSSESLSKKRFIYMSLLPSFVLGLIPFIIFLIFPHLHIIGSIAILSLASGVGDYINAYFAYTQMPDNALTFLYQEHSYWYIPNQNDPENPPAPQLDVYNN